MEFRSNRNFREYNKNQFRVRSPVKSFRDLEVYKTTIQLSGILTSLEFLKEERYEIKKISEEIPKLIAEGYGDKFDSIEIATKKLDEAVTLITDIITKLDLLRERYCGEKEKKVLFDNLLTKYSYQKLKVLNLKKAWIKVFTSSK
ncbi:MAG: hypothetical protein Q8N88_03885 [Nanoarchaeota archaeon]|nr:hypothetical protein [Nanoarchaeota archaeon]